MLLETDRLLIRRIAPDDASFILELLTSDPWLRFIGDRGVRTLADARQYILNGPMASYEQYGYGAYVVQRKNQVVPIGLCGLYKRAMLDHPDIGFALLPDYIRCGYGYEAASAVLRYETERLNLTRVLGITDPNNQSSIQLLERLGMRFEKRFHFKQDGEPSLLYGTPTNPAGNECNQA